MMESIVARWHLAGWSVGFREGYIVFDDRLLNEEVIRRLDVCPERVVLGSSRCMQLRSSFFPKERFLNNGMRRAVLEDQIAVWQLYRRKGWCPRRAMIGVDAWLLDADYWKSYWLSLRTAFQEIVDQWQLPWPCASAVGTLGSATGSRGGAPFVHPFRRKLAGLFAWSGYFIFKTHEEGLFEYVRRGDGSVCYHAPFRDRSPETVAKLIRDSAQFPKHPVSPAMAALLSGFVDHLISDGVEVSFIIPPYHPAFMSLNGVNASGQRIAGHDEYMATLRQVESIIRDLASRHNLKVIGSFDPKCANASEDEFYDWMHPKPEVFQRLLEGASHSRA